MKKKKLFNQETYDMFINLFNTLEDRIEISDKFKYRLLEKYYSNKTYIQQIQFLEWFKENFTEEYKIKLYYFPHNIPLCNIIIDNKNIYCYSNSKRGIRKEMDYILGEIY